ncbi:MAG: TusE/DsrC/DsvC family sulfur relay protein [Chromatiaceae bacterium]
MTTATVSVPLDGEGFLVNRDDWSEEVAVELARADDFEMTSQVMDLIVKARAMYEEDGVVPPIRIFAKKQKMSTKDLYDIFRKGPMKLICKWGGLPKPTGCV